MNGRIQKLMLNQRGRAILGTVALLAALAAVALLRPVLSKAAVFQPAFLLTGNIQEEVNTSAFGLILGEARASMADLMWVKTERYFHRGVAFTGHLNTNAMAQTGEVHGVAYKAHPAQPESAHSENGEPDPNLDQHRDENDEHDEGECGRTMIPEAKGDYRGYVGTIQRAVQPWQDTKTPHEHTAGDELIPFYRLLTYSNPHHWRGYVIGTWCLVKMQKKDPQSTAEAARFIEEGIRNNPEVFQLQLMDGRVKNQQKRWREALAAFERAIALALKIRPEGGGEKPPIWSVSDEEDFAFAVRYIPFLSWRKLNDLKAAQAGLERGLKILPGDIPLQNMKAQLAQVQKNGGPVH